MTKNLKGYYVVIGLVEGTSASEYAVVSNEVLAQGPLSAGKQCTLKWSLENPDLNVSIVRTYGPYQKEF